MNWFSAAFKKLFGKSNYSEGYAQVSNLYPGLIFQQELAFEGVLCYDENYIVLEEQKLRDFIFKYWDGSLIQYHGNSPEFPDCDDFTAVMYAGAIRGAIKERFPFSVLFGEIVCKKKGQGWHKQNWSITAKGKIMLFEPQNGTWTDDLSDLEEIREVSV